ncbi:MAG: hypothetical protein CMK07_10495 [Ponticaulis sp.]|nr:hypothetical protein [Ponticaulis sp.]
MGGTVLNRTLLSICVAGLVSACATTQSVQIPESPFSERLAEPRLVPVTPGDPSLTDAQVEMLESRPDFNIYKTLAHHPELYARWSPLGRILLNGSTLEARHREIVMLRMGWLCQAPYEWSQHARIARDDVGFTEEEIRNIAVGQSAAGWNDTERTLIQLVDDLRYKATISDDTWAELKAEFTDQEIMDLLFTAAQYQLVSMALNSLGVQLDPVLDLYLPTDLPAPALATPAADSPQTIERLPRLNPDEMTPEQFAAVEHLIREDGSLANIYAVLANHPVLFGPRYDFGSYIKSETSLSPRIRELLILRTAVLMNADYEWAHHVPIAKDAGLTDEEIAAVLVGPTADIWSTDERFILQAADDLRREAFITDAVWAGLKASHSDKQLVELIYTVGGYSMTALALNAFDVPIDDGLAGLPEGAIQ